MELSFCELKTKDVVNTVDGKNLGKTQDLIFTEQGKVTGIVVPGKPNGLLGMVKGESIFIPWCKICKIGDDVVLVELGKDKEEPNSHDMDKFG